MEIAHKVILGLGTNLGEREKYLANAIDMISADIGTVIKASRIYITTALNPSSNIEMRQPDYLNMVVLCRSTLSPQEISKAVHLIEDKLGLKRENKVFWGPREIDIDILSIDDLCIDEPGLKVPHPEMYNRDFVLFPLRDVEPDYIHPLLNKNLDELISGLKEIFIKGNL